ASSAAWQASRRYREDAAASLPGLARWTRRTGPPDNEGRHPCWESLSDSFLRGSLPGRFSGFSCTLARNAALRPAASETVASPYFSRILSTAARAFRQRSVLSSSNRLVCPSPLSSDCA